MPTTTDTTAPADVRLWLLMHRSMRTDAALFATALERLDAGNRDTAGRLGRWFAGYTDAIHAHHGVEDTVVFPALAERVGTDRFSQLDQLEADHHRLDAVLHDITERLGRLAMPTRLREATRAEVALDAAELRDLLNRHLDLEEQEVVPLFVAAFSNAEFEEMEARANKGKGLRQLRFIAPWVIDHCDAEERAAIFAGAPFAIRVVERLFRPGYRRLAAVLPAA